MSEWMDRWMDGSMRTKTEASDYSFVGCSASFKPKRAFCVQLCSVQCRYPRARRRCRDAASSENHGEDDSGFQLVLFCCQSFWFREALVESFLGLRSGAIFLLSFETEQCVCKGGLWELLFCQQYLYVNHISMLNCTWVSQGSVKCSFHNLDKEG